MEDDEEWSAPAPMVRMANLCCISGFAINGVAAIHSEIVRTFTFKDFGELLPEKFQNKTNVVTPRRWLAFCNPQLSSVITEAIGTASGSPIPRSSRSSALAKDPELQKKWRAAKQERKALYAKMVEETTGVKVSTDAMFDIQIKRIREYKRQLLNIMGIIHRYNEMKAMTPERANVTPASASSAVRRTPPTSRPSASSASSLPSARLSTTTPRLATSSRLSLSPTTTSPSPRPSSPPPSSPSTSPPPVPRRPEPQHEVPDERLPHHRHPRRRQRRDSRVRRDDNFSSSASRPEVEPARAGAAGSSSRSRFTAVMDTIKSGVFGKPGEFDELLWSLGATRFRPRRLLPRRQGFPLLHECQDKVSAAYKDQDAWTGLIISTAFSGKFNSDRTIDQYATEIWDIKPLPVP